MGLSNLRAHKFRHNFVDTSDSLCHEASDGVEDTIHFLLECAAFSAQRVKLLGTVSSVLGHSLSTLPDEDACRILLYGHSDESDSTNKLILLATITFVLETKRL